MEHPFCTIYIARHGLTDYNQNGRTQGHLPIPLNEVGRQQSADAARFFMRQNIRFDKIFASDLVRAAETATIIAREHQLEITLAKELRERYSGPLQGTYADKRPPELKELLDKYYQLSPDERWHKKPFQEWESEEEVIGRSFTFLRAVAASYLHKTVLMVTHGWTMRVLLAHLGAIPKEEIWHLRIKSLGYYILHSDGITFEVKKTVGFEKITPTQLKNPGTKVAPPLAG